MSRSVCGFLQGGLGNNLSIMATTFAYARDHDIDCVINPYYRGNNHHSRERYIDTVFSMFPKSTSRPDRVHDEPPKVYTEIPPYPDVTHLMLHGYYQHPQYFDHHRDAFLDLLKLPSCALENCDPDKTCFIHVRRGDYVNHPLHHVDLTDYYGRAMDYVKQKHQGDITWMVFSDDMNWCKQSPLFQNEKEIAFCEEQNEVCAIVLMSKCKVGGVCANSSFSWWGAYINSNPDKIVTFPRKWFNGHEYDIAFEGSIII